MREVGSRTERFNEFSPEPFAPDITSRSPVLEFRVWTNISSNRGKGQAEEKATHRQEGIAKKQREQDQ